jgi:hypothetical protein
VPTTPRTGLRYPATSDSPNGPLQMGNLAADLDDRVFPKNRPYIDCYLRRSDGSNLVNASNFANAVHGTGWTDMKVYPIAGAIAGTWDTNWNGQGLANTTPGFWSITSRFFTSSGLTRWMLLETRGTEQQTFGGADSVPNGFGLGGGSLILRAPTGLQVYFEMYNSASSTVNLRTTTGEGGTGGTPLSTIRVAYMGPI